MTLFWILVAWAVVLGIISASLIIRERHKTRALLKELGTVEGHRETFNPGGSHDNRYP